MLNNLSRIPHWIHGGDENQAFCILFDLQESISQCFGSVSGYMWIHIEMTHWIRIRIPNTDLDPDPGQSKWCPKREKSEISSSEEY